LKRDLELIRHILLCIEANDEHIDLEPFCSGDYEDATIELLEYHVKLLIDVDFIKAVRHQHGLYDRYTITRITMFGHDYLDAVRNNKVWGITKSKITDNPAIQVPLEIITRIANQVIMSQIGG